MRSIVIASLVVAAAAVAALVRLSAPGSAACAKSGDCARCHRGSAPATHTPAYVRCGHGPPAVADRGSCLGCHEEKECGDCHLKEKPEWHTEALRKPDLDRAAREEHISRAAEHRGACAECHASRFHDQCAMCHRFDEGWLSAAGAKR
ncbi:MAG: hypothetical protein HY721_09375 [Planctomycetes bacterium]|nr:hypothetical protein [Planctomycetota bacterium]